MSFLDELLSSTRRRVAEARGAVPDEQLEQRVAAAEAPRGFAAVLESRSWSVIAEIKRASPARGPIAPDLNAGELARAYADAGAAALSVLTEPEFFSGSLEDLEAARAAGPPVLRKDFVIDPYQLLESRAVGADAVLLIVRAVGDRLGTLLEGARALRLDALVEVHERHEIDVALAAGATTIGINHRDLETFEVDPERTAKLAPAIPDGCLMVALSGVRTPAEAAELRAAGARAVLVGESLVTAPDPARLLRALAEAA